METITQGELWDVQASLTIKAAYGDFLSAKTFSQRCGPH